MKVLTVICFFLFSLAAQAQVEIDAIQEHMELTFLDDCNLVIEVETNVNEFECQYLRKGVFSDFCFQGYVEESDISFSNAILRLPVEQFDCGGKLINQDFVELLYRENHPYIQVEFLGAHWYSYEQQKQNMRVGKPVGYFDVEITLAGNSKKKVLNIYSTHLQDQTLFSKGSIDINMTEFGIEPPEKFLGMVKVKEMLTIHFNLNIKRI